MCENKKASHVPLTADTHIPLDCCFTPIFTQLENQPTHFREWVVTPLFEEERFVVVELEYLSHTHTLHDLHCTCRHLSVFTYIIPPLLPHTSPPWLLFPAAISDAFLRFEWLEPLFPVGEVCCGWARVPATQHNAWLTYTHATCIQVLRFFGGSVCLPIFKITNGAVLFSSSSVLPFSKREEEQEEGMRGKSCNKEILALLQLLPIQSSQVTVSQSSHSVKIHQTCTHNIYI